MSQLNFIRKLFVDSRARISGDHNSFTIQLPQDIQTTPRASVYLVGCAFGNVFMTVTRGVNDRFFWLEGAPGPPALWVRYVAVVPEGNYSIASLATALQTAIATARNGSTALSVQALSGSNEGKLKFQHFPGVSRWIPTYTELLSPSWKATNWDTATVVTPEFNPSAYNIPTALNSILYLPFPSSRTVSEVTTGHIDLQPYREVYMHCSLTQYRTMKVGDRSLDCMCRIPIDVPFGAVVQCRHLSGQAEAVALPSQRINAISFSFRDWAGNLIPISQPVSIELGFLSHDLYDV
jgi:hypothetical protein